MKTFPSVLLAVTAAVLTAKAVGAPLEIKLPAETVRLTESPLPGYALAQSMCLTCHSADYLRTQPVSSRTFWQGSVAKMQKTFGAPIPDSAVEPLVDYLAKTYGAEAKRPAVINPAPPATPGSNPKR